VLEGNLPKGMVQQIGQRQLLDGGGNDVSA
jgi:hypothetical protein